MPQALMLVLSAETVASFSPRAANTIPRFFLMNSIDVLTAVALL